MTTTSTFSVYLDSSYRQSVNQILPFFKGGPFTPQATEIIFRRLWRTGTHFRKTFTELGVCHQSFRRMSAMPKPAGRVVLYPFNAQSNCRMCTNRQARHVFIGHGESEKAASSKPILRIYDHVAVAGSLACSRLVDCGIFTRRDVDGGRLIRLGDTFVQHIDHLRPEPQGAILYAPTWEGGLDSENYSSIEGGRGFDVAAGTAAELGARSIAIQFHPNTGARRRDYVPRCWRGIQRLRRAGFEVRVLDTDLNTRLRAFLKVFASSHLTRPASIGVRLALVDVSGMAATCLAQNIPHLVLRVPDAQGSRMPAALEDIHQFKSIRLDDPSESVHAALRRYFDATTIEQAHRDLVFGYQAPELATMTTTARLVWLADYVEHSPYWADRGA